MLWTGEERLPAGDGGSGGAGHRPEARVSGDQVRLRLLSDSEFQHAVQKLVC